MDDIDLLHMTAEELKTWVEDGLSIDFSIGFYENYLEKLHDEYAKLLYITKR